MPELPEVETVRRGLAPAMEGREILRVEQRRADLRWPFPPGFAGALAGRRVEWIDRRAKFLVAHLSGGLALLMHLGMTGRFLVEAGRRRLEPGEFYQESGRDPAHDHVVFALEGEVTVTYNDARRFGAMDLAQAEGLGAHPWLNSLGVEPLGEALDGAVLARLLAGRSTSLKAALMDQRIVAGLGNIYVCEALHRSGLSPKRAAGSLAPTGRASARTERLSGAIKGVLAEAVEAGGSTLRDFASADGASGAFQHRFRVYDREGEPCPKPGCSGTIKRLVQGGRSTFYCPACQR